MSTGRDAILGGIRKALGRAEPLDAAAAKIPEARIATHAANAIPARGDLDAAARVDLFEAEAVRVNTTVTRVPTMGDAPAAIADYLKQAGLPARAMIAPAGDLKALDWKAAGITAEFGIAGGEDHTGVSLAFAGIAETG
ncbi:MAG: lactate utilization protein C, partial [Rhodospirillales bacterium]|nr:lactate utilization protein C [Rhodospirillales bacterium]